MAVPALFLITAGCGGSGSQQSSSGTPESTPAASAPPAAATSTAASPESGASEPASVTEGATIYQQKCTPCHGPQGRGDGPLAKGLTPKPRNHTDGAYMSTRTDDELLQVIRNGKPPMPPWGKVLTDHQIRSVLAYVRTLAKS